jgi:hypothetical protein
MSYRPLVDDGRAAGVYRRMVVTASGRFAILDDGLGFSLAPWRPLLEQRIGQQLSATLRGDHVTLSFGRQRVFRDSFLADLQRLRQAARGPKAVLQECFALAAQRQIAIFLKTEGLQAIDPDGDGPVFATPIKGPLPEDLGFLP